MITLGGYSSRYLETVEVTDLGPKNNSVCQIANLPESVYSHSMTYTKNGLLVCGGYTDQLSNKCHILASNGSWVPFTNLIQPRSLFSMTKINQQLVIIGGLSAENSIEYINIAQGSKWAKKTLDFDVYYHCSVVINNSTIMVIGGYQDYKVFRHFILFNYHSENIISFFLPCT